MSAVLVEMKESVALVTLNEPERRNAFSPRMMREITPILSSLAKDENVQVVVFTGAGDVFSGGADLKEMQVASPLEDRAEYDHVLAFNRMVWNFPKVTMAAVNGHAVGGGSNLVAWCDLAVADEKALLGYPEVRAGIASATVIAALLKLVGRKALNELVLTGKYIPASRALELGLVNRVVPAGTALSASLDWAAELTRHAPHALAFTKEVIRVTTDMEYDKALDYARNVRVLSRLHPEFQKRIDQYLQKRGSNRD
jgi:enoyl-CoA hydratase/carnithine racemase